MGGLVLVYFLVFSLRFCCRCNWNDWLMHLGQLLNHEHNLSLVKYNFLIMAVGDERERLEALQVRAEQWLQFNILPSNSLKDKNTCPILCMCPGL